MPEHEFLLPSLQMEVAVMHRVSVAFAIAVALASGPVLALAVASALLIWLRHHENIARILKGTEPRIGAKAR